MWSGEKGRNQHPYIFENKKHKKIKETYNKKAVIHALSVDIIRMKYFKIVLQF